MSSLSVGQNNAIRDLSSNRASPPPSEATQARQPAITRAESATKTAETKSKAPDTKAEDAKGNGLAMASKILDTIKEIFGNISAMVSSALDLLTSGVKGVLDIVSKGLKVAMGMMSPM